MENVMVTLANITHRDPDILSGSPVFVGTRVPVRSLFDHPEGGESIDEFLHQFPSVKREFAIAVLDANSGPLIDRRQKMIPIKRRKC
jgi:uncharacterized protein (DUF433 family)